MLQTSILPFRPPLRELEKNLGGEQQILGRRLLLHEDFITRGASAARRVHVNGNKEVRVRPLRDTNSFS